MLKNIYIQPIFQHKEKKTNKKGLLLWCVVIFRPTEDNVTDQQIFFCHMYKAFFTNTEFRSSCSSMKADTGAVLYSCVSAGHYDGSLHKTLENRNRLV